MPFFGMKWKKKTFLQRKLNENWDGGIKHVFKCDLKKSVVVVGFEN